MIGVNAYLISPREMFLDIYCYKYSQMMDLYGQRHYRTLLRIITKTYLYNFDHLQPHFYIVKLGFTGVYIIFLISAQKHILWSSLEPPRRGGSNEYPQSMFCAEI